MIPIAASGVIDGKYAVVRYLGNGAYAAVYEGLHLRLQRHVAIKVLRTDVPASDDVVERFEREALAATRVQSEHVVRVYDVGNLEDGRPYIVMELLEGVDLAKHLEDGPLTQRQAVRYAVQVLTGLADTHAEGIVHRDIKPENIFVVRTESGATQLKLVDFGVSKLISLPEGSRLTQTNTTLGSPIYMSPEQCRATRGIDARSDLYSLAVVLYELLTGTTPHSGENYNELMFAIALTDARDPRKVVPDLDAALAAIVMKGLARDRSARYGSAVEFRDALVAWAKERDIEIEVRQPISGTEPVRLPPRDSPGLVDLESETLPPEVRESAPETDGTARHTDDRAPAVSRRRFAFVGITALVLVGSGLAVVRCHEPPLERGVGSGTMAAVSAATVRGPLTSDTAGPEAPGDAAHSAAGATPSPSASPRRPSLSATSRVPAFSPATSGARRLPSADAGAHGGESSGKAKVDGRTIRTTF